MTAVRTSSGFTDRPINHATVAPRPRAERLRSSVRRVKLPARAVVSFPISRFLASCRSMNWLIWRSHVTNCGRASAIRSWCAPWAFPLFCRSMTRSMRGSVRRSVSLMLARMVCSSGTVPSAVSSIVSRGPAEAAYASVSVSMSAMAASSSSGSVTRETSLRAMARSCTLPRKLMA